MKDKCIKVPSVLYRQGTSQVNDDGTIRLSISSDEPYLRYDWWNEEEYYEVLGHRPEDVDLTRMKAGTALLFNHDRDIHLGLIDQPELTNGKCYVAAKISQADDVSSYRTRIKERILKDSSVGYELVDDGEEIGEKDGIKIYRFRWAPFEASLVTIPADITVGVGRERDLEKPKGEPRQILIREKDSQKREKEVDTGGNPSQKRETSRIETAHMETPVVEPPKKSQAELDAEKRQREDELKQTRESERTRIRELNAIAKTAGVPDAELEKAINDGMTEDGFRKFAFENYWGKKAGKGAETLETPTNGDLGNGANGNGQIKTVGDIVVASEAFTKRARSHPRFEIDIAERSHFRTTLVSGAGGANMTNIEYIPTILQVLQQRLTVADLLGAGQTDKGSITYPQQTTYVNATAVTAEGAAKPEVTFVFTETNAPVRKIAGWTKISEEVLDDFPAVRSVIDQQLPFMVQQTEEAELLSGDGTGQHLTGLLNTSGIQTQTKAAATPAATNVNAIFNAITKIRVNSFLEPDGIIVHPNDWQIMRLTVDANGQYYAGGPFTGAYGNPGSGIIIDRLWGLPVVVTTAITQGTVLVGAFKIGAMVFRRKGLTVQMFNQNEDDAKKNLIMLLAEERLGLVVWRPAAFCKVTGIA
jgi:HK97 family phage major capsid protein